jgi:hypothetical protein
MQTETLNYDERRISLLNEFSKMNHGEQMVFLCDCFKYLSYSFLKLILLVSNDSLEKKSMLNSQKLNSFDNENDLTNLLEEQANDTGKLKIFSK